MSDYLLGLATLPIIGLVVFAGAFIIQSVLTLEDFECSLCPGDSREGSRDRGPRFRGVRLQVLPRWWIHKQTRRHRAEYQMKRNLRKAGTFTIALPGVYKVSTQGNVYRVREEKD